MSTLTKQDILALRKADSTICFDFLQGSSNDWGVGKGQIRAHAKVIPPKGYHDTPIPVMEYTIDVPAKVTRYKTENVNWSYVKASECMFVYRYEGTTSPLGTFVDFLKEGDSITLEFLANSNGYCDKAGFCIDQLIAKVSLGSKIFNFLLAFSVVPRDSYGRMIQGL